MPSTSFRTGLAVLGPLLLVGALALPGRPAAADEAGPADTSPLERQIQLTRSIVKIEARTASGYALGTGVVIGPHKVVASCHVTRDATRIDALHAGLRLKATAQAADLRHDLCLLEVPELDAPAAPLGQSRRLQDGQPLLALGFSGGLGLSTSRGKVIALHALDGARVIRSSTGFISGASGGGLFDEAGHLVGVLTFRLRGADRHYFSVPAEWLDPLLSGRIAAAPIAPLAGRTFWEGPSKGATPGGDVLAGMPHFLRATVYELEQRWAELGVEARAWLADHPGEPQARRALDLAQGRMTAAAPAPLAASPVAGAASTVDATSPAAGGGGGTGGASVPEKSPEPSRAERLLFMAEQLQGLALPTQLVYEVVQTDQGKDNPQSFEDSARVSLVAGEGGACCDASGEFLSGPRAMRLPDVPGVKSNPLLLYFLEFEVRRLERGSKGQASHFRRRIRLALVDQAEVKDIEADYGGRKVKATQISITPYLDDPFRLRFMQEATRRYRFIVSDEVPGHILAIEIQQPGVGEQPRKLDLKIRLREPRT